MHSRLRKSILAAAFLLAGLPLHARINMLEPWSPGLDLDIPKFTWNHGVNGRIGQNGYGSSTDFYEAGYFITTPLSPDWEAGAALAYISVNRPSGFKDDSGFEDLAFGAKHRFSETLVRKPLEAIAEAGFTLPTGDEDNGIGAGGFSLFGGLGAQIPGQTLTGYAHLGLRLYTEGGDTRFGNVFSYMLGAKYVLDPEWTVTADIRGFNH